MDGVSRPEGEPPQQDNKLNKNRTKKKGMHPSVGAFRFLLFSWLGFGNLNNGSGNAGLSALNGNNTLGNANWNYLARISE